MTTKLKFMSMDTLQVDEWSVDCSMCNGQILVSMFNTITEEYCIQVFRNEREANFYVNSKCLRLN